MKANKEWLNEFVKISDLDDKYIEERFTITGTKVEFFEKLGGKIKKVVIGKVLKIEKHPDADKLVVCQIDVGDEEIQIATGATNLKVGDIVPVCLPNSVLPSGKEIKPGYLRGVLSNGMMCSYVELEVPKNTLGEQEDDGIFIFPKKYEKYIGESVEKHLGLDDTVFDFEITPNRPDCLGILGIAKELSVAVDREFKGYYIPENIEEFEIATGLKRKEKLKDLEVEFLTDDVKKYAAVIVENVKNVETPEYIVKRLKANGINSRGILVDISNYIMVELGLPTHAFDKDYVGKKLVLRLGEEKDKAVLLDEKEYNLKDVLLITGDNGIYCAGGIMGTKDAGVSENTKNAIFEFANFYGARIRWGAKNLGIRTDSSSKFEKGLPISYIYAGIKRLKELNEEIGFGTIREDVLIKGDIEDEKRYLEYEYENINGRLGINVPKKEIEKIFKALGFKAFIKEGKKVISIPTYRKDIKRETDLSEEVIRFYGYDKLIETYPNILATDLKEKPVTSIKKEIRQYLSSNGYMEVATYGFTSLEEIEKMNLPETDERKKGIISLVNRLSSDYSVMRTTTLPAFITLSKYNLDMRNDEFNFFEIGKVYINNGEIDKNELPLESVVLSMITTNDFYKLKKDIYSLLNKVGINRMTIVESKDPLYHPGKSAEIVFGWDSILKFGEINPKILGNYDIKKKLCFAEIDVEKLIKYTKKNKKYVHFSKFPAAERDLAVVVDENIKYEDIEKIIKKEAKNVLEKITLFDIFRDKEKIGENKKSLAFSLLFRKQNGTLEEKEINEIISNIVKNIEKTLGASLRS